MGQPQGFRETRTGDHRRRRVPVARHVHHSGVARLFHCGHGIAVRRQPDRVHRRRPAAETGEHVLLDIVHVHHAGRVRPRTRRRRASRRRYRAPEHGQVLHVLPVGVLRAVLPGHVVLFPQVVVEHAGGRPHRRAGQGPALQAGRGTGEGKTKEGARPLRADPRQGESSFVSPPA